MLARRVTTVIRRERSATCQRCVRRLTFIAQAAGYDDLPATEYALLVTAYASPDERAVTQRLGRVASVDGRLRVLIL